MIELKEPILFKKQRKRLRKTRCFTLSDNTHDYLKQLVKDEESSNASRAIDLLVDMHKDLSRSVIVSLDEKTYSEFAKKCFESKMVPARVLEILSEKIVKGHIKIYPDQQQ